MGFIRTYAWCFALGGALKWAGWAGWTFADFEIYVAIVVICLLEGWKYRGR